MVLEIISGVRPFNATDCYYLGLCYNCSIFLRAAGGEKDLVCFDPEKMRAHILYLYEGF
jgi:hypothetical protein